MTQEKEKRVVELEKLAKNAGIVAAIGIGLLLIGGSIALWAVVSFNDKMIPDDEHITDQNMPVRDMKNATYTWTSEEIEQMAKEKLDVLMIGAFLIAPGTALLYAMLLVSPSKRKFHELNCEWMALEKIKEDERVKYCPECGLKLKKHDG